MKKKREDRNETSRVDTKGREKKKSGKREKELRSGKIREEKKEE